MQYTTLQFAKVRNVSFIDPVLSGAINAPKKNRKCLPTEGCRLASYITGGNISTRHAAQSKRDGSQSCWIMKPGINVGINLQANHQVSV